MEKQSPIAAATMVVLARIDAILRARRISRNKASLAAGAGRGWIGDMARKPEAQPRLDRLAALETALEAPEDHFLGPYRAIGIQAARRSAAKPAEPRGATAADRIFNIVRELDAVGADDALNMVESVAKGAHKLAVGNQLCEPSVDEVSHLVEVEADHSVTDHYVTCRATGYDIVFRDDPVRLADGFRAYCKQCSELHRFQRSEIQPARSRPKRTN